MDEARAELLGMHAGDGTLYRTNRGIVWELRGGRAELEYYAHVSRLLYKVFGVALNPKYRSGGTFGVQTSVREITSFFRRFYVVGKKTHSVRVPDVVFQGSRAVKSAFVRGYFDTDGCVRFDKIKTVKYPYPKLEISTASSGMLDDAVRLIRQLEMKCYFWSDRQYYKLCLPGLKNLKRWCEMVGTNNPKHLKKVLGVVASWEAMRGRIPTTMPPSHSLVLR